MVSPLSTISTQEPLDTLEEPASATTPPQLSETGIVTVTSLGHFICHLGELIFPGVLVAVIFEFSVGKEIATSFPMMGYALMGFAAPAIGLWADRWGPTRVYQYFFLGMFVTSLLVVVAYHPVFLVISLTLLGVALSIYHPVGLSMISLGVKARGRAMGVNGIFGSLGIALGPPVGLLAVAIGYWRGAYILLAILSLGALLLYWRFLKKAGQVVGFGPDPFLRLTRSKSNSQLSNPEPAPEEDSTQTRPLMFLYATMLLAGFNYRCFITALPTFLTGEQPKTGDLTYGAIVAFSSLLLGGVGQLLGGHWGDRFGARYVYPTLIALVAPLFLLLGLAEGTWLAVPIVCTMTIFLFGQQPVENSTIAEITSKRRRSIAYGAKFALSFGIGAVGSFAAGLIWEEFNSMGPVFFLTAALEGVMVVLACLACVTQLKRSPTMASIPETQ